jgi:uncharacterized membrane protein YfcA
MNMAPFFSLPENATTLTFLLSSLVVLLAGVVRGLTGFGFSALCVSSLSVFMPPSQVVPALFVLEIAASISLLKTSWPDVHWPWLRVLAWGNLLFIPLGVLTQQSLPDNMLRLLIAVVIAVAMVFNQTRLAPAVMRASLVVFFLFTDLFALLCLALMAHLSIVPTSLHDISGPTAFWSVAWLPAMLLGIWLGHRQSARISPERFRRGVQILLVLIAVLMGLRVVAA